MAGAPDPVLVDEVKSLCRSDVSAKAEWCAWCDAYAGGTKDPNRMDSTALDTFLSEYHAGTRWTPEPGGGKAIATRSEPSRRAAWPTPTALPVVPPASKAMPEQQDLAEAVKVGQRVSSSWKSAWAYYAETYGGGTYDPAKHTKEFLAAYFEFVASGGESESAPVLPQQDVGWATPVRPQSQSAGPPAKRPRVSTPAIEAIRAWTSSPRPASQALSQAPPSRTRAFGEIFKEVTQLAERVKQLQKADPYRKQQWSDFCDQFAEGTKDPMRHTVGTLQQFLQQCDD